MKKHIFYLLSAALCLLAGCTEHLETDPFGLSKNAVDFTAEGGEKNITVNTRCDCTLSCGESWVTFSPQYVEAGKNTVTVTVAPNPTFTARQAAVTIFNEELGVSDKIAVRQSGIIPRIDCDAKLDVTYSGGTFSIEVDSSIPWEASTMADWIALSPANGQAGKSTLSVEIQRSLSEKSRQGEIILTNAEHKVSRKITVTQTTVAQLDKNCKIIYTTDDNKPLSFGNEGPYFNANIIEHLYDNGKGILIFDEPVTSIKDIAFNFCSSLTSITIPDSVTEIGSYVFWYCSSLTTVYCRPQNPPSLGGESFDGTPSNLKIYVPRASVDKYKSASWWSSYSSQIVGYDF
ncbi:MAG: leucine-rich repeat protein [Alistipes sp.]|nr:leucine-rich repeat protein [Alistipes sp.]